VYVKTTVKVWSSSSSPATFSRKLGSMVDLVVDAATKASPTTGSVMTHLTDCYCGSGLFCIGSSLYFDVCVGIKAN